MLAQATEVFLSLGGTAPAAAVAEAKSKEEQAALRPSVGSDDTDDGREGLGLPQAAGSGASRASTRPTARLGCPCASDAKAPP